MWAVTWMSSSKYHLQLTELCPLAASVGWCSVFHKSRTANIRLPSFKRRRSGEQCLIRGICFSDYFGWYMSYIKAVTHCHWQVRNMDVLKAINLQLFSYYHVQNVSVRFVALNWSLITLQNISITNKYCSFGLLFLFVKESWKKKSITVSIFKMNFQHW